MQETDVMPYHIHTHWDTLFNVCAVMCLHVDIYRHNEKLPVSVIIHGIIYR